MVNDPAHVSPGTAFWRTFTKYDRKKIVPEIAVRNTLGFVTALVVATALGSPGTGVLAGIGALNVSYSDSRDPYIIRVRRMSISSVLCGLAVFLGAISGHSDMSAVVAAVVWAFASGMLVALGSTAGDLGVITLVTLVVFAAHPLPPLQAAQSGLLALGGGLLQTLFSIALWPLRRHEPERRIVASLYSALAKIARDPTPPSSAPPASDQISDAQDALSSLRDDHSEEAEQLAFQLNQAERIRLSLLNLGRLLRRLNREKQGEEAAAALKAVLEGAAAALDSVGSRVLETRTPGMAAQGGVSGAAPEFSAAAANFRVRDWPRPTAFFAALIRNARQQTDALGGQLRSASAAAPRGERQDEREPWRLRFSGRLARLQANLSLHSTVFRHALRLAVCMGIGDGLGRGLSLHRTYWIPMTIAIVLKPDFTATFSRGLLRILGTFAGLFVATLLFHFLHTGIATDIALLGFFVFLLRWIGPANYGIFVATLSSMIVVLIAVTGVAPMEVVRARAVNTVIGGVLALIVYGMWPTWERTQVGPALADMLESYRGYFSAVMAAYRGGSVAAIDAIRIAARRARSNAEASADRVGGEPGANPAKLYALTAILVNSHSFVHAVMALESGLYHTGPAQPRAATLRFAAKADVMLISLANALRSGSPLPDLLPDLRESHNEILASDEAPTSRYTLVNIETDRIVTSLNTLSEQVAKYAALR